MSDFKIQILTARFLCRKDLNNQCPEEDAAERQQFMAFFFSTAGKIVRIQAGVVNLKRHII